MSLLSPATNALSPSLICSKNLPQGKLAERKRRAGQDIHERSRRRTDALRQDLPYPLEPQHCGGEKEGKRERGKEGKRKEGGSPRGTRKGMCGPKPPAVRQHLPSTAPLRVPDYSQLKPALVTSTSADNLGLQATQTCFNAIRQGVGAFLPNVWFAALPHSRGILPRPLPCSEVRY